MQSYNLTKDMVTKNDIKLYRSLKQKKFRKEYQLFVVEGKKGVEEAIKSKLKIEAILSSDKNFSLNQPKAEIVSQKDISTISSLKNAPDTLCIVHYPKYQKLDVNSLKDELILILDDLQDPGNLGTIIRIADWYGIKNIICSNETVDQYNSKTIQATMGSYARINLHYTDLEEFLPEYKNTCQLPVYATLLEGENIYNAELSKNGAIIIGNEGNGISSSIKKISTNRITIPKFGKAESLNAGIATAIVCSEFRRTI